MSSEDQPFVRNVRNFTVITILFVLVVAFCFYLTGTSLFVLNSIINLNNSYKQYYKNYEYLSPLIIDEEYNTN